MTSKAAETKKAQAGIIIVNILISNTSVNLLSTAIKAYNLPDATVAIALGARSSSAAGSNKNTLGCYKKYCLSDSVTQNGIRLY